MGWQGWQTWLDSMWGPPGDCGGFPFAALASNIVIGSNPPYTIQDYLAFYPKWGGTPLSLSGVTATQGSPTVTLPAANSSLVAGQPVAGSGIPNGTFIQSVSGVAVTLTNECTASASIALTVWNATLVPVAVILAYIALASAALVQARWLEMWTVGMGLMVSHFLTLYARSDGNPNSNIGQIAAQGVATGIQVSKAAGDVTVSYQPVQGIEDWGAYNLTTYGQQLATLALGIGAGAVLAW